MSYGIKICDSLTDLMLEASRETEADEVLQALLEALINAKNGNYSCGSGNESGSGQLPESPSGKSVLVVELDDEVFDKLAASSEPKEDGVPKVIFKRKHPKEDPKEDEGSLSKNGHETGEQNSSAQNEPLADDTSSGESAEGISSAESPANDDSGAPSEANSGCPSDVDIQNGFEKGVEADKPDMATIRTAAEQSAKKVEDFANGQLVVNPNPSDPLDLEQVNAQYEDVVDFVQETRQYTPSEMLPFALRNRGETFKRSIERKLKAKKTPNRRAQRAGSIDSSRAANLAMQQLDLFKRRAKTQKYDVCTYLLIDNSGSMYGEKKECAMEAAAVVEEGFKELCPLKIALFDADSPSEVRHVLVKDWEEAGRANLSYNAFVNGDIGGGNKDGYSIRVASADILSRPEKARLLLVLSDGLPSEYHNGATEGQEDVKKALAEARASGIVPIGIYFGPEEHNETFKNMYGATSICTSPDKIESQLTAVMSKFFFA